MMKFEFTIKTDCLACCGIVVEFIKKIEDVKSADFDNSSGKIIIEYEGQLSQKVLAEIIKEKTGYEIF